MADIELNEIPTYLYDQLVWASGGSDSGGELYSDLVGTTAQSGTVITDPTLKGGKIILDASGYVRGGQSGYDSGTGFFLGNDSGTPKFSVGNSAGNKLTWDGSALSVTGNISATTGTIGGWTVGATSLTSGSGANTVGLDSGGTNPAIYAGSATPASAPFRVTQAGDITATSATITGSLTTGTGSDIDGQYLSALSVTAGSIANATITTTQIASATIAGSNIASATIEGSNIASATIEGGNIASATITGGNIDASTITGGNIASGTITGGNIDSLTITAGKIANLTITSAQIANSTITGSKVDQNTITGGTTGNLALTTITADNISASTITAAEIAANTITANEIAANTITASEMNVSQLSAVAADLGTITAGNITIDSSGYVKGGQTAYATGTGFWLGYDTDAYKFSIGDSDNYFKWDGSSLAIEGKDVTITGLVNPVSVDYSCGESVISAGSAVFLAANSSDVVPIVFNRGSSAAASLIYFGQSSTRQQQAQAFTVQGTGTYDLKSVYITINKYGSPSNATVRIQGDSSGEPDGSDLASVNVGGSVPGSFSATFSSPPTLSAGTQYWVVLTASTSSDLSYYVSVARDTVDATSMGDLLMYNGSSWSDEGHGRTLDCNLEVVESQGSIYRANAVSANTTDEFIGFANEEITYGNNGKIQLSQIETNQSGLSVGSVYYLKDADSSGDGNEPGEISTSAGTVTKKVGIALSATDLLIKYTI